jgi:hypothetical protein
MATDFMTADELGKLDMKGLSKDWVASSDDYRRKSARKNYSTDIMFASGKQMYRGTLYNISVGGAFIATKDVNHLYEGEQVSISIPYTDGSKYVKRKGIVIWKNDAGFGVEFI